MNYTDSPIKNNMNINRCLLTGEMRTDDHVAGNLDPYSSQKPGQRRFIV